MKTSDLTRRLEEILGMGQKVVASSQTDNFGMQYVNSGLLAGFRSASLSFIDRLYGQKHPHYLIFDSSTQNTYRSNAEEGTEILGVIKAELEGGWLNSVKSIVTAEVFADFLQMADHLQAQSYKDPAAVMAGSVLEEHLRQLCLREGIPTEDEKDDRVIPKKADRLNADLAKAEVYSKLDQKQVTAWLDLRNNAAHGKYEQYNSEQVSQMLSGITEFMVRVRS